MKSEIVESFAHMAKEKKIDKDLLSSIIKDVFGMMIKKKYGQNANYDVIVNMDKGDIEMYLSKTVVEEVTDPDTEISVEEARDRSGEELEPGDDYTEVLDYLSFGRRHIVNLKQNLNQKIREVEKEIVYNEYKELKGEIIVGEIYQIKPTHILLIHNSHELTFPKSEQIAKEKYKKGESIRVYIKEVSKKNSGPTSIIVSRAADDFLKKLFELEIPEIYDGIIEIKGIAREPGERAKVAVYSYDDRIDAVGACVGMKGIRIHSIVRELANENIDVINYTDDIALYIARALAPAKLKDIYLDKENKVAKIIADEDQVSLIIGKNGQNIKLASKLTGYEIEVERKADKPKDIEEALERELARNAELEEKKDPVNETLNEDISDEEDKNHDNNGRGQEEIKEHDLSQNEEN
ncbi:MAG: transcription termination factor NusA [Ignavibacteria bacterium]|nr:transcription termination factor NusA [Ignavibacteria bacterium]